MSFDTLGLSPVIKHNLSGLGYRLPTPVQAKAIPLALEGRDVIGSAQTGTGKTAAFGLPMIERLVHRTENAPLMPRQPRALVLAPTRELALQMRLWWDLVLPDGYGYSWGRSLGVVSYEDTMEIVGFLARHAEFRPAPLAELASAYYQAWRWLRRDYKDQTHLLSVFAFGRGNFSYITREREWQQTTSFLGKAALAHASFTEALAREGLKQFPAEIVRPDLTRFEFFRRGERSFGVWLVRQGPLSFTLPITSGTKPGVADYLP